MMNSEEKLELLNQIGKAEIAYSNHTKKFYLNTNFEIKENGFLISPCEHRSTIENAINATFDRLTEGKVIVINTYTPERREYKYLDGEFFIIN